MKPSERLAELGINLPPVAAPVAAYVPANTPPAVVTRLHDLLVKGTASPAAKSFFATAGVEAWTTTPEALAAFQATETQKWGKVIKAAGIEPE